MMRPSATALLALLLIAAPVRADVVDDYVEEQRIEEGDDVNLPPEHVEGESVADATIREQRCTERAIEIGLSPAKAEEWCSRG